MMKAIGMIPARMASSRFPGKALAPILGIPMIEHVFKRSAMAKSLAEVYVATCDEVIAAAVEGFGGRAVMTAPTHQRCTDRIAEAIDGIGTDADVVVNIQGDEPMVLPEMIDRLVESLAEDPTLVSANLAIPIETEAERNDPNLVKVVVDRQGHALYLSREPIPSHRRGTPAPRSCRQGGIIAFRTAFLRTFTALEPTPLEIAESVDMLRAVEHGYRVKMVIAHTPIASVDTEADRRRVEAQMRSDPLVKMYAPGPAETRPRGKAEEA